MRANVIMSFRGVRTLASTAAATFLLSSRENVPGCRTPGVRLALDLQVVARCYPGGVCVRHVWNGGLSHVRSSCFCEGRAVRGHATRRDLGCLLRHYSDWHQWNLKPWPCGLVKEAPDTFLLSFTGKVQKYKPFLEKVVAFLHTSVFSIK